MFGKLFSIAVGLAGKGALVGLIATLPMTIFMLLMQRLLPKFSNLRCRRNGLLWK